MQSWRDKYKEAHKTLSQYICMRQQITSFDVLKISGGEAWLTRTAISRSLDGILLPEFYKKVAEVMQEEKTTLKSLPNSIDDIILDQWVSMHPPMILRGILRPKPHLRYRTGSETAQRI